jgi:hypothetical protein
MKKLQRKTFESFQRILWKHLTNDIFRSLSCNLIICRMLEVNRGLLFCSNCHKFIFGIQISK